MKSPAEGDGPTGTHASSDNTANTLQQVEQGDDKTAVATAPDSDRPACFKSTIQEVLFVLTATMSIATGSWLTGSIIVITSFVGRDLSATSAEITWLASASSLTSGAFLLFFGRVADLFGRKTLVVGSFFLYSVFALVAGFVNTPIALDTINGVLGVFAASTVPGIVGILGIAYERPSQRKNAAFACFSGGNPIGFVFGTIFGGIATTLFSWRANFWLIAMIFFVFTVIGFFTIPKDWADKKPLQWATIKDFDIVGTLLTIGGIGMFSAAISLGDTASRGWTTNYVLALLILGIVFMVAFVFWEKWFKDPIVPMSIWRDRDFSIGLIILLLGYASFVPTAFFAALFFQDVWGMSSLMTAVHLLPMAVCGTMVNIVAAMILHRVSNKLLMYIATAAYSVAFLLLAVSRTSSSYWAFYFPALCIMVIGADLEFNVVNLYVMSSMPPSQQSVAGGIFQTVAKLCGTVGLGISTAIFDSVRKRPSLSNYWDHRTQPYTAVYWFAFACAALSFLLVPFLKIGTQGGQQKSPSVASEAESPTTSVPTEVEKNEVNTK